MTTKEKGKRNDVKGCTWVRVALEEEPMIRCLKVNCLIGVNMEAGERKREWVGV